MHPDAILGGLKREFSRLDPKAEDYKERKAAIDKEIKANEDLPRPEATAENPETVVDHAIAYLEGLKRELERAEKDREAEIKAEIKRVETEIKAHRGAEPEAPVEEEIPATETPAGEADVKAGK